MTNLLPKSRIVKVEMLVALPISATKDQVEEWISLECGHSGGMSGDNPLGNFSPEAISAPVLTDTGKHLHSEAIDNQDGTYTVRNWTDAQPAWGPTAIDTIIADAKSR